MNLWNAQPEERLPISEKLRHPLKPGIEERDKAEIRKHDYSEKKTSFTRCWVINSEKNLAIEKAIMLLFLRIALTQYCSDDGSKQRSVQPIVSLWVRKRAWGVDVL